MWKIILLITVFTFAFLIVIFQLYKSWWNRQLYKKQLRLRVNKIVYKQKKGLLVFSSLVATSAFTLLLLLQFFVSSPNMSLISEESQLYTVDNKRNMEVLIKEYITSKQSEDLNTDDRIEINTTSGLLDSSIKSKDYSTTNIQVEGVDEIDIAKTDGKYVYTITSKGVVIANAYPKDELSIYEKIEYENSTPIGLYVDEEFLVVIANDYTKKDNKSDLEYTASCFGCDKSYSYSKSKKVFVYSQSNNLALTTTYDFEGDVLGTRKINGNLLIVMQKHVNIEEVSENVDNILPKFNIDRKEKKSKYQDIYITKGNDLENIITAYNLDLTEESVSNKSYLGSGEHLYVTHNNIYITKTDYGTKDNYTNILKFGYSNSDMSFIATEKIQGRIKNEFSLDEYLGHLRVVTTVGWSDNSHNNLYILSPNLEKVSSVENLAFGETVQATRFIDNRVYIVTFRQIDPLFIIDTSDLENPILLGELKVQGFSTYLHAYDENHLIGFGFDAEGLSEPNPGRIKGFKISLFNVEDANAPKEVCKETILYGNEGWNSADIVYNHKALLFSKEKNLIAFPFSVMNRETREIDGEDVYFHSLKQGYLTYDFNLTNCFEKTGYITHIDTSTVTSLPGEYYYGSNNQKINKGLFIDDYLYTVSNEYIKISSINNPIKVLEEIYIGD